MWSKAHGVPWDIVVILTKAVSAFHQRLKGAVFVQAIIPAVRFAQALNLNRIGIIRFRKCIFSQPERAPLHHSSHQLLTSQFGLVNHPNTEAKAGLFAGVLSPLEGFKSPTAVAYAVRLLFALFTVDPLEAAKQAIEAVLYRAEVAL